LRGEVAPQPPHPLQLLHLLADAALKRAVQFRELSRSLLQIAKELCVLNCDHGLVSERGHQINLLGGERLDLTLGDPTAAP
jgi:hypothetical protein